MFKIAFLILALLALLALLVSTKDTINTYYNNISFSQDWETVATSTTGFYCIVIINASTFADIRMLGKTGQQLRLLKHNCLGDFPLLLFCGGNIHQIQIRSKNSGEGTASAYPINFVTK